MEPGCSRGDLLFLYQSEGDFEVGQITVFTFDQRSIPIVHRILEVHKNVCKGGGRKEEGRRKGGREGEGREKGVVLVATSYFCL